MKDFKRLQEECMREVEAVGIKPGNIVKWSLNSRAKTRWGLCVKYKNGDCEIQIAERLIEDDRISEKSCKDTMIHEILHSCAGCHRHTGKWKKYAELMNDTYGYNIKRVTSGEEKGVENYQSKGRPVKYIYRCSGCGQIIMRKRECKFTRHYRQYICGCCGKRRAFKKISGTVLSKKLS